MPLTRDFKESILEDMRNNPGFRAALLREGVDVLLGGEFEIAKEVFRDYVNATMGFDKLSKQVGIPPKSLMRMLGRSGNPQMKNLFAVIAALQAHAGIELHVAEVAPVRRPKRSKARKSTAIVRRAPPPPAYPQAESAVHGGFREAPRKFKRS